MSAASARTSRGRTSVPGGKGGSSSAFGCQHDTSLVRSATSQVRESGRPSPESRPPLQSRSTGSTVAGARRRALPLHQREGRVQHALCSEPLARRDRDDPAGVGVAVDAGIPVAGEPQEEVESRTCLHRAGVVPDGRPLQACQRVDEVGQVALHQVGGRGPRRGALGVRAHEHRHRLGLERQGRHVVDLAPTSRQRLDGLALVGRETLHHGEARQDQCERDQHSCDHALHRRSLSRIRWAPGEGVQKGCPATSSLDCQNAAGDARNSRHTPRTATTSPQRVWPTTSCV